jgi:GT2 family glycosyltransferase
MDASIIIPSKNRLDVLFYSLEYTVSAVKDLDVEIILINDGDQEINIPLQWKSKISIHKNPKSGVASARNLGARLASTGLLIFMDDDMLIHKGAVERAIAISKDYPDSTLNINWIYTPELLKKITKTKFGRYLHNFGFTSLKGWNKEQPWNEEELFENIGITSQFLAIHKDTFNLVGGYDETFPHAGYEDYDFSKRLKKQGVRFYIWPKDIIYHHETDRHELYKWLDRKKRGGETRKHAVLRGNNELALHYSSLKSIILTLLVITKRIWIAFLNMLPNLRILDGIYGKLVNILLATSIFEGYTKIKG